ncbi:MAG: caspase family protein, partial [Candidatus Electryoneaceae bacterium]|nr:caspase family protein [Candidatus Electryoneaceae bacterium]
EPEPGQTERPIIANVPDRTPSITDRTPPKITITQPEVSLYRGNWRGVPPVVNKSILVKGIATDDSGVYEVLVNQAEANLSSGGRFTVETLLYIGDNSIKVTATDIHRNTRDFTFILSRKQHTPLRTGTDYALLIGIDEYDEWDNLSNPIDDVEAVGEELTDNYGFQVEYLTDNPTKIELLTKIKSYARKEYEDNDQLFIMIAGHGQFDDVYGTGYIVAKDSERDDNIKRSYISHTTLREQINCIPCDHILYVVDACFGGTLDPVIAAADFRGESQRPPRMTSAEYVNHRMQYKTRRFLTSGGKEYVPDESVFCYYFLEALRTMGGDDGILTLFEIYGTVDRITPVPRQGIFGGNEPGSDFLFIAR